MKRTGPLPRHTRLETRTPLRRSSPLPRGETPRTRTPIKKRNAKRKGSRFPHRRDPEYCAWIRLFSCPFDRSRMRFDPPESELGWILLHKECDGPIECAHVKSRGAGGDDRGNTIPLCRRHHREQHDKGMASFQRLYGFDLAALAKRLEALSPGSAHPGAPTPTPEGA
jgi:hypothetical protein